MKNVKKVRALFVLAALLAAALSFSACDLPDYQLYFWVDSAENGIGDYVDVTYTLENIGYEDLRNVRVQIQVVGNSTVEEWTSSVDLSVDQSVTRSISIYCPGWEAQLPVIVASGWDSD